MSFTVDNKSCRIYVTLKPVCIAVSTRTHDLYKSEVLEWYAVSRHAVLVVLIDTSGCIGMMSFSNTLPPSHTFEFDGRGVAGTQTSLLQFSCS